MSRGSLLHPKVFLYHLVKKRWFTGGFEILMFIKNMRTSLRWEVLMLAHSEYRSEYLSADVLETGSGMGRHFRTRNLFVSFFRKRILLISCLPRSTCG